MQQLPITIKRNSVWALFLQCPLNLMVLLIMKDFMTCETTGSSQGYFFTIVWCLIQDANARHSFDRLSILEHACPWCISYLGRVFSGATENLGQSERHVFTNPVELGLLPSWIAMFLSLVCDLFTTEFRLCVTDDPLTAKECCQTLENCLYYSALKQKTPKYFSKS